MDCQNYVLLSITILCWICSLTWLYLKLYDVLELGFVFVMNERRGKIRIHFGQLDRATLDITRPLSKEMIL
jgi:hypothetical protein